MSNELKPKIRFKGFVDAWELKRFDSLLEVSKVKNNHNFFNRSDVLSVSKEYGVINQIMFLGRSFAGKLLNNYKILKKNQLVYTKSPLSDNPYGIIKCNKYIDGIVSSLYAVYNPKNIINPIFIDHFYSIDYRVNKLLHPLITKGAKNTMNVSDEALMEASFIFPQLPEQNKIAQSFTTLDSLLNLHQTKITALKKIKQTLLEKMFPVEGSNIPSIRFVGFTYAWELKLFSDVYLKKQEKNNLLYGVDSYISVASNSFKQDVRITNLHTIRNYVIFRVGDIAFEGHTNDNFPFGRFVQNSLKTGIISNIFSVYRPKIELNFTFMKYFINNDNVMRNLLRRSSKSGVMMNSISDVEIAKEQIILPKIDEQYKLAKLLTSLDSLLTLHQRKCEKLKKIKQELLNKMFV